MLSLRRPSCREQSWLKSLHPNLNPSFLIITFILLVSLASCFGQGAVGAEHGGQDGGHRGLGPVARWGGLAAGWERRARNAS